MIKYSFVLLVLLILASCKESKISVVTTTAEKTWVEGEILPPSTTADYEISIDRKLKKQVIEGFGACFNELGWDALSALSTEDRSTIMQELFSPGVGSNFTLCRMPVGANDFSFDWYSYNEVEGDFAMNNFSIGNDLNTLVPYIKAAQNYMPDLKLWASPWSPPSWMKWNKHYACATSGKWLDEKFQNALPQDRQGKEGTNMFIQKDQYLTAYAKYFSLFIDAYRQQDINIAMVMPQNEFNSCQVFPSCTWQPSALAEFVADYLGPEMQNKEVEVMLGTVERGNVALIDTILNYSNAAQYISGLGFQWAGKEAIQEVHKKYPEMTLFQTEQECGDGKNDWDFCKYSWTLMKHYLNNGANAYMYWNMALSEGGVSRWGWSQNSLVTVDKESKTYRFNYEYYLMKHLSHFVFPGARMLENDGAYTNALLFENVDGSIVVLLQNDEKEDKQIALHLEDKTYFVNVLADSFSSIVIE